MTIARSMPNDSTGPDDPFAHLVRAHGRIEEQLVHLEGAADALRDPAHRASALEGIADVLAFFSLAGAQHNDDEERTLFPRLRGLPAFTQMLDAFDVQHRMNDAAFAQLVAAARGFAPGAEAKIRDLAFRLADMHRGHIIAEERALFPLAARALAPDVVAQMGVEMSARGAA